MGIRDSFKRKRRIFVKKIGGKTLRVLELLVGRASLVGNSAFFEPQKFEWVDSLEANWQTIRVELERIMEDDERIPNFQDISSDQKAITNDDKWKTYFFHGMGYKAEQNCARCPETTKLIESIPGMTTAFFSILYPHKHIPEHRGLYKGFVRYHLGLIVPEPRNACRLRVDREFAFWEEGKSLLFDDTYLHEVWNDTNGIRVVLFLDVIRPLRFPMSTLNNLVLHLVRRSGYVQDAKRNQEHWQRRLNRSDSNFKPTPLTSTKT